MTFQAIKKRFWKRLACAPTPFWEVGPYLALGFLMEAFPPLQRLAVRWQGDFIYGVLGGVSVVTLVFPRGRMTGWAGRMKAWGLGLFLGSLILDGYPGLLSGWMHQPGKASPVLVLSEADPWQHFVILLLVSGMLGLVFHRLTAHRLEAQRQRELANLASQAALRGKLAPHFIFNTLNTLHAQIEADPRGAQATTERLAELLRKVIEVSDCPTIPIRQELALVEAYLGIEQARLGDRLSVVIQVPEELESLEVPPLSLQVLVENAVKHGVAPLEEGGEVRIGAERQADLIHLWVEDPGTGASPQKGTGTALETLRQRLGKPEDLTMAMVNGRHRVGFRWRQA